MVRAGSQRTGPVRMPGKGGGRMPAHLAWIDWHQHGTPGRRARVRTAHPAASARGLPPFLASLLALLVACAGPAVPGTLDVDGRLLDLYGSPVGEVDVIVAGFDPVDVGPDGRFSIEGIVPPYDVTVVSSEDRWAHRFVGLEVAAPRLAPLATLLQRSSTYQVGLVTGSLSPPVASGQIAVVTVSSTTAEAGGRTVYIEGADRYEVRTEWYGGGALDATVRAVLYDVDDAGRSTGVAASGSADVTITDLAIVHRDLVAVPVAESSLTLQAVLPDGHHPNWIVIGARVGEDRSIQYVPTGGPATSATVRVPDLAGSRFLALISSTTYAGIESYAWRGDLAAGADATLAPPAPPAMLEPLDGAVNVGPGDVFRVAERSDAGHLFTFEPVTPTDGPRFYVSTAAAEARLPDLADVTPDLAVPSGVAYRWRVFTGALSDDEAPPFDDDATSAFALLLHAAGSIGTAPRASGSYVMTGPIGFTTR